MKPIVHTEDLPHEAWPIHPYYKRELAIAYAPGISPYSALNRLAKWLKVNEELSTALLKTGYTSRQQVFTSLQVKLIFQFLGKP